MPYKMINKEPVTLAEIKEILEKEELVDYRAKKTLEYAQEFSQLTLKQAKELIQKIKELNILRLNDEIIVKIIDVFPKSEGSLKAVLQGFNVSLTKDQLKSILNVLVEYL